MKIRKGFVSNSSSTSFVIYGICVDNITEKQEELSKNLDVYYDPWENIYIGKSLTQMQDTETLGEFKKKTEKEIKEIFGDKEKCEIFQEGWYNG